MSLGATLGVTAAGDGIDVAVHAPDAEAVALCLFDADDREMDRLLLPSRIGPVHCGRFPGIAAGARYGLRAFGPWDPANGLRFDPSKLLLDPWATAIDRPFRLHPALFEYGAETGALVPKAIAGAPPAADGERPGFDWDGQVIYELHVKGFTAAHPDVPPGIRGTFAGLAHPAAVAHLLRLGVTTVELMPCAAWIDERHLPPLGLTDYWGYNPVALLAPDPRLAPGGWAEVQGALAALHAAGLSVILDAVLNHTGEGDEGGPTLSLRGLDNRGYYRLAADRARYVNDAGCGNVLATDRPAALRLALGALRAWAVHGGFDGFRLDLATTLARGPDGFQAEGAFLAAVEQDPVLSRLAMIAEPWDTGWGGYQLGRFPARWGEWNDRYRDDVRRFWRADPGALGAFATRFAGSADVFGERPSSRSVNFVTAHDGFPLADLVSYESKRNAANGEGNRDGTRNNLSWNGGAEGPTDDPAVLSRRSADARALLATLLLSRGTPMLSMGDELGRTQGGNNNAYCQDNAGSWVDWASADQALIDFTAEAVRLRRSLAPLFVGGPLTGSAPLGRALPDVTWLAPDGGPLTDWDRPGNRTLVADLCAGAERAVIAVHAGAEAVALALPDNRPGFRWAPAEGTVAARSVAVFREVAGSRPSPAPTDAELDSLAQLAGIEPVWWDVTGGRHQVGTETKRALLAAMRLPGETRADLRDSLARLAAQQDGMPPAAVVREGEAVSLRADAAWVTLVREDGSVARFATEGGRASLPPQPLGRHHLLTGDDPARVCHLTVAPPGCWLPPAVRDGGRRFGIAAHLYSLRSPGDQGIGDFRTLRDFASEAGRTGAAVVGLNPLHALFPHDRSRASPYHPSDRRFLDPIYIDVSGFPGGAGAAPAPGQVDYEAVWSAKRAVLRDAFRPGGTVAPALQRFATFQAIAEVRGSSDWQAWPEALQRPDSAGVAAFAAEHAALVGFHAWMQGVAEAQLAAAACNGLEIGLYRDLAVGAAPDGAEAWEGQDRLMTGVSVGAPPDPFSAGGQVWCLPPPDPWAMRREGYAGFNELLVANMRHAGALRIDHVMGLRRLFVVPDGASAADGAYVAYPMRDLLAQVALQSQRAQCLVVGEDLGTVPEGMAEALAGANVLSYGVLWFERDGARIKAPAAWRRLAAACVSTHDLPTLAGWWAGADIKERAALGLLGDAGAAMSERAAERRALTAQLQEGGWLAGDVAVDGPLPQVVAAAVHAFVASSPAMLALAQADDLAGETAAVNLPGTDKERPNWRRRLEADATELLGTPLARAVLRAMQRR